MNAFLIELDNKVGELARITEAIAARNINITAISGATCGGSGSIAVMTADEAGTRTALQGVGCSFREMEATEAPLPNVPGSLAKATVIAKGSANRTLFMLASFVTDRRC